MNTQLITSFDWLVFFLILTATIGAILKGKRSSSSSLLELLVMGRRLTLPFFIASLTASWYGGLIGVTSIAFEKGLYTFITQGVFWYFTYLFFAFFLASRLTSLKALTLPDLVEKNIGRRSAKWVAVVNFFHVLPVAYVTSIGLFLQVFTPLSFTSSMIVGVFFVILYSLFGGLRAVVYSDLVQCFVMCLSVFVVLLFSIQIYGIDYLPRHLPSSYFTLRSDESWGNLFAWAFIALTPLIDPGFYQRCFAVKSRQISKKGILICTFIWICFDISTTTGAMYARATLPDANPQNAYIIHALDILPMGWRGFFLGGIVASLLSTIDSYLFLAATTLYFDLGNKKWREKKGSYLFCLLLAGVPCILLGILFDGDIKDIWITLGGLSVSCLLVPLMASFFFPRHITDTSFLISSITGAVAVLFWKILAPSSLNALYIGTFSCLFCFVLCVLFRKTQYS